jgi:hypothetical protein
MVVAVLIMGDFEGPGLTAGPYESRLASEEVVAVDAKSRAAERIVRGYIMSS